MPHDLGVLYPTPTGTGTLRTLSSTASTAASNTKISIPALTVTAGEYRFIPEATNSTTGTRSPTSAFALNPMIALGDAGTLIGGATGAEASKVIVNMDFSNAAFAAVTVPSVYVSLYIDNLEVAYGSQTFTAPSGNGSAGATVSVLWTANGNISVPANSTFRLVVGLLQATNTGALNPCVVTLNYTSTGTRIPAGILYTIQASRSISETRSTTETPNRSYQGVRSISESRSTSDSSTRTVSYVRNVVESRSTSDSTSRLATFARVIQETRSTIDSVMRFFTGSRTTNESSTTTDSVSRVLAYARTVTEGNQGGTVVQNIIKPFIFLSDD